MDNRERQPESRFSGRYPHDIFDESADFVYWDKALDPKSPSKFGFATAVDGLLPAHS
jgi:hypothetical protein